ncbi:hypothetical protein Y1Q_0003234 [Alligator mississippiensis]|uniref:Uncharacterized protein n=1 Tax=Alligator mississippiensis TaxID=8496 RepID=A0A151ME11_ALLMI|nr:hypothetical protein Y1Q_0003234 [Alligator mississippiensis]
MDQVDSRKNLATIGSISCSWVQKVEANPGFTEIRNVGAGGGDRTRIQNTKQIVKSEVPRRKGNENERV